MNKIYRVFRNASLNSVTVGYLINEDNEKFTVRVQNGVNVQTKVFDKDSFSVKSIFDKDSGETYKIEVKDRDGKKKTIELSKTCFGGCG